MLEGCGLGIAVSNANPDVMATADELCDSNEADGVATWINQNILK